MKIVLTKTQKIELLKAVQQGMFDTDKMPEITKEINDMHPFIELMIQSTYENTFNKINED